MSTAFELLFPHTAALPTMAKEYFEALLKRPILPDAMNPCGKKWFRSKEEAETSMDGMTSQRGPKFVLNAYYCEGCDGFHIGHTRRKR